jgi:uncharacterized protein
MLFAFLDASALAKRYVPERGTLTINHLFSRVPPDRLSVLAAGLAEVKFILVRKRNIAALPAALLNQATLNFHAEICSASTVQKVPADADLAITSFPLIESHSVNSTDAMVLRAALNLAALLRLGGNDLFLVASDLRLLRAAQAEGLLTFNPEIQSPADLDALLGP